MTDPLEERGRYDPLFQKMVAAWTGDASTWGAINRELRDAIVSFAAARAPYYRRVWGEARERFDRLPVLDKPRVREHFDELFAEGIPAWRRIRRTTSGSTGDPMVFYRDASQGPAENLSARRFLQWLHDVPSGARMVWLAANPQHRTDPPPSRLRDRVLRRGRDQRFHGVSTVGLTPRALRREVRRWTRLPAWWLYGHASVMEWVADRIERDLVPLPSLPSAVVTTSDQLTPPAEARIARVFDRPVHSWYGSHEFNGYVAGSVPGTRQFAFNPLLVHMEVLDEKDRPTPAGEVGRLVLTDLNNYVFPLIRYDTGDLAISAGGASIGGFPLVEGLEGRASDRLVFPSGRILTPVTLGGYLTQVRGFGSLVRFFQCAQVGHDALELRVVWARRPSAEEREDLAGAVRRLADPATAVSVRDVSALERLPSGKAWVVRRLDEDPAADATRGRSSS